MPSDEQAADLLSAIADVLASRAQTSKAAAIIRVAKPTDLSAGPRHLPVTRHLSSIAALAPAGPWAKMARAIADLSPTFAWTQNANYVAKPPSPGFLDDYGYVEFAGPERSIGTDICRVGFLLLGPNTLYPEHAHPAEEVYYVVAGRAAWWRADADWLRQPPGTMIHHPPHLPHATRCEAEPMLALYCWTGDIGPAARLIRTDAQ